jgi:anti-sigma factor RsiW
MSSDLHPTDELHLLVEGSMADGRHDVVAAHVAQCARCQRELDALRQVRSTLRASLPPQPVPAHVSERIRAALEQEARRGAKPPAHWPSVSRRALVRWSVAFGAAAVLATLLVRLRPRDVVREVESDFRRYVSDQLILDTSSSAPAALEAYFREANLGFATRVFDFTMMGYSLHGGSVHGTAGRAAALFAYRDANGRGLVCQMYPGTLEELPDPAPPRVVNGIDFRIYERAGVTLVLWEEGPLVCVLATDADSTTALELAVAKAVRV